MTDRPFLSCTILSFLIVTFGLPGWSVTLSLITAALGYALFWYGLQYAESPKSRFTVSAFWFFGVQLSQLSWLLSHPYAYIIGFWVAMSALMGLQFGLLSLFVTKESIKKTSMILSLAGCWVLMEWGRMFIFCGFTFDQLGSTLAASQLTMQMATIGGGYLLTFWVVVTNLQALRFFTGLGPLKKTGGLWLALVLFPYLFGSLHLAYQQKNAKEAGEVSALIVQTGTSSEAAIGFTSFEEYLFFCFVEWEKVLNLVKDDAVENPDMILLPEGFVPFSAEQPIYQLEDVHWVFQKVFGEEVINRLPTLTPKNSKTMRGSGKRQIFVTNTYWAQAIASLYEADVVVGLGVESPEKNVYNAAVHMTPDEGEWTYYAKQVLLPMGEYIPFQWVKDVCAKYGIQDSFAHGETPMISKTKSDIPFGMSICYEETFGSLMAENKKQGAQFLINLTSDGWYPKSKLSLHHFHMAKQRTVELGIPLLRSCSTGVSGVVDCYGRTLAKREEKEGAGTIVIDVPIKHYPTLYSKLGDTPLLIISFLSLFFGWGSRKK